MSNSCYCNGVRQSVQIITPQYTHIFQANYIVLQGANNKKVIPDKRFTENVKIE